MSIHTIPVPRGWSAEQAWEAIQRGVKLTDPEPAWANIETDENERFVRLIDAHESSALLAAREELRRLEREQETPE